MFEGVSKWRLCSVIFFTVLPIYSWYRFFKQWKKLEEDAKAAELFYDRHNCVVMYAKDCAPTGWPNPNPTQPTNRFVRTDLYDSILYFIHTANRSIDIAMMLIDAKVLIDALVEARKRNVTIRIILDFEYNKKSKVRDLQRAGIDIMYYVCPKSDVCSILHYKYMVKDYCEGKGYAYFGSLNWTSTGIQENYENTVFTSNPSVVQAFHENFEQVYSFVKDLSENNNYVRAKLSGVQ